MNKPARWVSQVVRTGWAMGMLAGGLGGCGLVSSDITSVPLDLPSKSYSFDTGYTGPAGTIPMVACGDGQLVTDCCNPAPGVTVNCAATPLVCAAGACTYQTTFKSVSRVDLGAEAPEYKKYSGQTLVGLSLNKVNYTVTMNDLNVPTPEITIYLAPDGITDPADPSAAKFGTIAPIPAKTTLSGTVTQAPGAGAAFGKYAQNWATPFTFIATAPIVVKGGEPIPMGKMVVTVSGQVKIQPSL